MGLCNHDAATARSGGKRLWGRRATGMMWGMHGMNRYLGLLAGALLGAAGLSQSAHAGFVNVTSNVVEGAVTFQYVSCHVAGAACSSGGFDGLQWEQDGSNTGVVITTNGGAGPLVTTAAGGPADLSIVFNVVSTPGYSGPVPHYNSVGVLIGGSNGGSAADDSLMNVGETVLDAADSRTYSVNPAAQYGQPEQYVKLGTPTSQVQITKDIYVGTPADGATLAINTVTQDLLFVPEPASLPLMLFGTAAVAATAARRKRSRQ
jgi:PEP-CTERM motif